MNKLLIYQYIKKLRREDIINYCNKVNIDINNNDVDIIYSYIKNDYKRFFNNQEDVINEIKSKINPDTFNYLMILYEKYKGLI